MSDTAKNSASNPFSLKTVFWVLVIGIVSFSALVVLSTFADDLRSGDDGKAHSLSKSAIGYYGITELMKAQGIPVIRSRTPPENQTGTDGMLVITPNGGEAEYQIDEFDFERPTLVVLPKWIVRAHPKKPGWVMENGFQSANDSTSILGFMLGDPKISIDVNAQEYKLTQTPNVGMEYSWPNQIETGYIRRLQTIQAENVEILLESEAGPVLVKVLDYPLYILSEPDLLNTQGIADIDNARAGIAVLQGLTTDDSGYIWDMTLHGYTRTQNFLKLALEPPFLSASLCILMAAMLIAWQALTRFGSPVHEGREFALGKDVLADNTAALIRIAKREGAMAPGYAELTRRLAARATGTPKTLSDADQAAMMDRLGSQAKVEDKIVDLSRQADTVSTPERLLTLARKLYSWRQELTHGRK